MEKSKKSDIHMGDDYGEHALLQRCAAEYCIDIVRSALVDMREKQPDRFSTNAKSKSFHVADLGSADGVNLIPVLKSVISFCRERNPALAIRVTVQDSESPATDMNRLLQNVNAALATEKNVFVEGMWKSFYESLFPEEDVDLMLSGSAVHWLSAIPVQTDSFCYAPLPHLRDTDIGRKWSAHAEKDWETFLLKRQRELKPGGKLVVWGSVYNQETGAKTFEFRARIAQVLKQVLQAENLEDLLPSLCLPLFARNREQILEIFSKEQCKLQKVDYLEFDAGALALKDLQRTPNAESISTKIVANHL